MPARRLCGPTHQKQVWYECTHDGALWLSAPPFDPLPLMLKYPTLSPTCYLKVIPRLLRTLENPPTYVRRSPPRDIITLFQVKLALAPASPLLRHTWITITELFRSLLASVLAGPMTSTKFCISWYFLHIHFHKHDIYNILPSTYFLKNHICIFCPLDPFLKTRFA